MKPLFTIVFVVSLLLVACKTEDNHTAQYVRVLFSNGKVFGEGNQLYSTVKKDTIKIGIWKIYYPNGQLRDETELDNEGEVIRYNSYSDVGVLIATGSRKDNLWFDSEFFDSGTLKREKITHTNYYEDKKEDTVYIKEYYSSGRLMEESRYLNDELDGIRKMWDMSGNIVLDCTYNRGQIQK